MTDVEKARAIWIKGKSHRKKGLHLNQMKGNILLWLEEGCLESRRKDSWYARFISIIMQVLDVFLSLWIGNTMPLNLLRHLRALIIRGLSWDLRIFSGVLFDYWTSCESSIMLIENYWLLRSIESKNLKKNNNLSFSNIIENNFFKYGIIAKT